jgi:hypothetical protein
MDHVHLQFTYLKDEESNFQQLSLTLDNYFRKINTLINTITYSVFHKNGVQILEVNKCSMTLMQSSSSLWKSHDLSFMLLLFGELRKMSEEAFVVGFKGVTPISNRV